MTNRLSGKGSAFQLRQARYGWIVSRCAFVSDSGLRVRLEIVPDDFRALELKMLGHGGLSNSVAAPLALPDGAEESFVVRAIQRD